MSGCLTPRRVLVIDDDLAITVSLAMVLRAKGYEVATAADGAAGVAQYEAHHPDIVISDMSMPGQPGVDTIRTIRHANHDVLIVAMSGSIEARGHRLPELANLAGADAYLHKPFELDELLDALAHLPSTHDRHLAQ